MDKADENSQRLETYDAMRKTMESEREAKDQITEQVNKYATEDDDIVGLSLGSLRSTLPRTRRLRPRC